MTVVLRGYSNITPAYTWDGDWDNLDEGPFIYTPDGKADTVGCYLEAGLDPTVVYQYQEVQSTASQSGVFMRYFVRLLSEWYQEHYPDELYLVERMGLYEVPYGPTATRLLRGSLQKHRDELKTVIPANAHGFLDRVIEILGAAGDHGAFFAG